ncbi:I78 family peptidase inhibitor [Sphingomonas sp. LaA6.9]|uniref:I78 family peptidase inhibitor n=1 Tax=Sphingomonas sp. LaA6.9 TaxID=2919914 RepID=UPI001F4FBE32|nr:I78 family peptidase inhibitor [Sphingomonas sp. LaA6.9]MCJ8159327.1 I78 family peptidase inhibitor [Sphingomonas sp. LaA6.9]
MRLPLMILPVLLAGCATTTAEGEGGGNDMELPAGCKGDALQQFVGQTVSAELGAAALKASGARTLRWGPPRSAMTMDFRNDRLTISYDDDMKVTRASCG